ncbi:MAG: AraC family transcriptional regulator [Oscillospiraceae bacterium]|nr:AraC family transcriptional regulator [Oscillospiraceae bacterium]
MKFRRSAQFHPADGEEAAHIFLTWAGYRHCMPEHMIGWRTLEQHEMIMVVKGRGLLSLRGAEFSVSAGDVFFLFPGVMHFCQADPYDPWHIKWVGFEGVQCEALLRRLGVSRETPVLPRALTADVSAAADNVIDQMFQARNLAALGYFYILLDTLTHLHEPYSLAAADFATGNLIERIIFFLSLNYSEDIDVESVCKFVNYSRSYVSHLFKKEVGMSIPQKLGSIRLKKAEELLRRTKLSGEAVARTVGYKDYAYFSRCFRAEYGLSPAMYRRSLQPGARPTGCINQIG